MAKRSWTHPILVFKARRDLAGTVPAVTLQNPDQSERIVSYVSEMAVSVVLP